MRFELCALGFGTTIVPQNGRSQHSVVPIEQHGTMHLSGQADGANAVTVVGQLRDRIVDRDEPSGRILLAVFWIRARNREVCGRLSLYGSILGSHNGFHR